MVSVSGINKTWCTDDIWFKLWNTCWNFLRVMVQQKDTNGGILGLIKESIWSCIPSVQLYLADLWI